jgi:hypothetical protein
MTDLTKLLGLDWLKLPERFLGWCEAKSVVGVKQLNHVHIVALGDDSAMQVSPMPLVNALPLIPVIFPLPRPHTHNYFFDVAHRVVLGISEVSLQQISGDAAEPWRGRRPASSR